MNDMLIALVNEAFLSEDSHEYSINKKGNLEGYDHEVIIYRDAFIVEHTDHSACDGSHVSCFTTERVAYDPSEALENLQLVGA